MGIKNNDYCSQCPQKDSCREVYRRLGHSDAPPVAGKVFWAFVVPIGLFAVLVIGFDRWLPKTWAENLRIAVVFGQCGRYCRGGVAWQGRLPSPLDSGTERRNRFGVSRINLPAACDNRGPIPN